MTEDRPDDWRNRAEVTGWFSEEAVRREEAKRHCPFKVGDRVMRKPGASYMFPGVVISTGLKLDGKTWHCEVECIAPFVEGCTHVFPASQLVPLDPVIEQRIEEIRVLLRSDKQ